MKKSSLLFISIAIAICGCQNYDSERILQVDSAPISSEQFTGIQHDIMVNIASSRLGGYIKDEASTRATNQFSLSPYIIEGDTVLYVAQYDNGWEIYSANKATNMLLFSANEGVFDIDDPNMPSQLNFLIKQNASSIRDLSQNDIDYVDPSWGPAALSDETLAKGEITALKPDNSRVQVATSDLPPGHWVLLKSEEVKREVSASPKLTSTSWGQQTPWNAYSKWIIDPKTNQLVQTPAGCTAVAISQYLYFTHFKDGIPQSTVSNAALLPSGKDYLFSGNSISVWNKMAQNKDFSGTNEVALLIGHTGRELSSDYGINGTSVANSNCRDYLSKTYKTPFNITECTFFKIKDAINNGYPVIASARSNQKTDGTSIDVVGHTFLIDKYRETIVTYKYTYGLVRDPLPPGAIDKWISDYKDANGNIIRYAYTNEVINESSINWSIYMNWGADGAYDNISYSPTGNWIVGKYNFNLYHQLFIRDY